MTKRRSIWLLAGLITVALVGGIALYRPFQAITRAMSPMEAAPPPADLDSLPGELQTYLVMGADNTDGEYSRADSMVVVSYDPKAQKLAMLSIPRDVWTLIPGHNYDKINHSFAYGGQSLAVDTVERLLGIEIDHYVTLSFDGFIEAVDAVDGVELDVTERLYYEDPYDERLGTEGLVIDIQPGLQTMDGLTALKYARFRADAEGDIGRMRRQQQVIKALIKKVSTPAMLTRIPQLIPAMYSAIDTDLSVGQMLKLAAGGREALSNPLRTGSIKGEPQTIDGVFYFSVDLEEARSTAYEVLVGEPPDEEFLEKAREDQEVYQTALDEALGESKTATTIEGEKTSTEGEAGQQGSEKPGMNENGTTGTGGTGTGGTGTGGTGTGGTGTNGTGTGTSGTGTGTTGTGGTGTGGQVPAPNSDAITVALIDATGEGIAEDYAERLWAAGFRVARVAKSSKVLTSTLVVDHANQPQVQGRLQAVLPTLIYTASPDPKAEQALEIYLGTDLITPDQKR